MKGRAWTYVQERSAFAGADQTSAEEAPTLSGPVRTHDAVARRFGAHSLFALLVRL